MARRGKAAHNRKKGVKRQPNGRPTESKELRQQWADQRKEMTEAEALEVGLWRRKRDGIKDKDLRSQNAATVHGRLFLRGVGCGGINQDQLDAAEWFLKQRNLYHGVIQAPGAILETPEGHAPSGDEAAYEEYCKSIKSRWCEIERAIVDVVFSEGNRNIVAAIDLLLVRQCEQLEYVGDLRLGLNAIHKVRVGEKKRAA